MIDFFCAYYPEIIIAFSGAFFGFIFAILLKALAEIISRWIEADMLVKALHKELSEIAEFVKDNKNEKLSEKDVSIISNRNDYFRYDYFVWSTVEKSGKLFLLQSKKYYTSLLETYSHIYQNDLFEQQYFSVYKDSIKQPSEAVCNLLKRMDGLRKIRTKELYDMIKNTLKKMKV